MLFAGELRDDACPIEPYVLAADQSITKLPYVQQAMRNPLPMAWDTKEISRYRAAPHMLHHAEVITVVAVGRDHLLRVDNAGELFVEALSCLLAIQRTVRGSDHIVLDILGVHRHRPGSVTCFLGRQVLLDQAVHLFGFHRAMSPFLLRPFSMYSVLQ